MWPGWLSGGTVPPVVSVHTDRPILPTAYRVDGYDDLRDDGRVDFGLVRHHYIPCLREYVKKFTPYLVGLLAVLLIGWWGQRQAGYRAIAERNAEIADSVADDAARTAAEAVEEATRLRQAIHAATEARKAAQRAERVTQRALHTLLDSAETAAADSSVQRDSLARIVVALAVRIRSDSVARAAADSAADAERLRMGLAFTAQVAATEKWRGAYEAEARAHAATKAIPKKGLIARLTPYVAVAGVAYLAGSLDVP